MTNIKERLLSKVKVDPNTGCWNWTGTTRKGPRPYGRMYVGSRALGRKTVLAHRMSFEVFKGSSPGDLCVCHACDNPRCINPDHLWLGTKKDNADDRDRKGRNIPPPRFAGTIPDDVVALIKESSLSSRELAKTIDVSDSYIRQIRRAMYRASPPPKDTNHE